MEPDNAEDVKKHIRRGRVSGRKPEREKDYGKERVGGKEERKDGVGGYYTDSVL